MKKFLAGLALLLLSGLLQSLSAQPKKYYQEPTWKPRIFLNYDEVVRSDFFPASPEVKLTYHDPGFDESRLGKVPAPGIHPRVLITPDDLKRIREKVALGDKAPQAFRVMWEREKRKQNAFYALVTKDDKLGRELAGLLVQKLNVLEVKLNDYEKHPDTENMWSVERSIVALGDPDPPTEIWDLLDYDYLHGWMNSSERELARRVIARITQRRFSNYLMYPDHFMINNHQGFGMEYIRLMLLIEGQKGFNKALFDASARKATAMLNWFLNKDGMCYESIKGWLNVSAFTAVGLRQRNLLKHDHLQAKMRFFLAAIRWENGKWLIRDEMRASAFHVIWMMQYFHPTDEKIDFLYQSTFSSHDFLNDADAKWPNPVGISSELLLLYASAGMTDQNGNTTDWTQQSNLDRLKLPLTWIDDDRGYVFTRNSWKKDDLHMGFVCKQDFYYGGHEGSENNRITLWKDGVNWIKDNDMLATKATFLQNMLSVDGKGQQWPPVAGTWLGVKESAEGLTAAGDGKDGYTYTKVMQVHPLNFPSAKIPYYAPFAEGNFDLTRDKQVAFNSRTVKVYDGYGHTDYGPWSGETRLIEEYKYFNPMEQLYRTVHLARGNTPYVLVLDDAKKDDQHHLFEWNISVPLDVDLMEAITPEIQFQNTNPSSVRRGDIILGKAGRPRDPVTGKVTLKKGEPLCLIRVLWRNTAYGFPVPRFERYQGYNQVVVPAQTVSPEFRILVYPYKHGDPLPVTTWNAERTELQVLIVGQKDVYQFGKTDGGRIVLSMERNGVATLKSDAAPARPVITIRDEKFDINSLRYTRDENKMPVYLIDSVGFLEFERVNAPARILYTLDGSEPNEQSPVYTKPVRITGSVLAKAVVHHPEWPFGATKSKTVAARFEVRRAADGITEKPSGSKPGLIARVYEKNTKMFNNKGFFVSDLVMMPDLNKEKPILQTTVKNFNLPLAHSAQKLEDQTKGFYRFDGWFYATEQGVYQFDVHSCGPVTLNIAKQSAIEHTGVFHQQLAHRKGEVVLAQGWHPIELIITDPLFWNINSLEPMPLKVSYRINNGAFQPVSEAHLCYVPSASTAMDTQPALLKISPLNQVPELEKGFVYENFDQTGKRRNNDFLDIDGLKPYQTGLANKMESSESRNVVRAFNGYFYAPMDGTYEIMTTYRTGEIAFLGSKQSTCQNQVRISGEIIVQKGVFGRHLSGKVQLQEGWYPLSVRFGASETTVKLRYPDGQIVPLTAGNVFRPKDYKTDINNLYGPQGVVRFDQWNGKTGDFAHTGNFKLWINLTSTPAETPEGRVVALKAFDPKLAAAVDVNVSRGAMRPGLRVHQLKMRENAMTVALWFKTSQTQGRLFGKDGYNAFGKSYRTLSCGIENGQLVARPNTLRGPKIEPGKWYLVVLTASEAEMKLYLNGEKVGTAAGTTQITTDALDFFMGHTAETKGFSLWDRALEEREVKELYSTK
jgi:hypothetical protein